MSTVIKLACVFLASGRSRRFGENKLLYPINGRPMIDIVLDNHPAEYFQQTVVVTPYAPVAVSAALHGFTVIENIDSQNDIAITIRRGLASIAPGTDGCLFSVCDQPFLRPASIVRLVEFFRGKPQAITALGYRGSRGNPVLFPKSLFNELLSLPLGQSGSAVIKAHAETLHIVEAEDPRELEDIDYPITMS